MRNKIVQFFLLITVFLLTFHTKAEVLGVRDYVPKDKETFKEILSSDLPIMMRGWTDKKKRFVDGSPIEIWYISGSDEKKIIEGIVSADDNYTSIDGVFYQNYKPGKIYKYGQDQGRVLRILNGFDYPCPDNNYSMLGRFTVWNTVEKQLRADKKSQKIKNSYSKDVVPLSLEIITVDEYKYLGREDNGKFSPLNQLSGESRYSKFPLLYIDIKQVEDGIIVANIDPACLMSNWKKKASVIETTVGSFGDKPSKWDNWHVIFENGDEWNGSISTEMESYQNGVYRFYNGDTFKGNLHTSFVFSERKWPQWTEVYNLEIQFADGLSIKSYDWNESLKVKDLLEKEERDKIYEHSVTPTAYRDNIITAIRDKENKKKQAEFEKAELEKQQLLETQRKYISKYGEKYGKLVAEKKVAQGMTKQMVKEFLPQEWYTVTQSGNNETWRFNNSKVEQSIYKSEYTLGISMMARMFGTSVSHLIRTSEALGLSDIPLIIKFSGCKVTSITR